MNGSRFHDIRAKLGELALTHLKQLKIEAYRHSGGDLSISCELHCEFGALTDGADPLEGLRFAANLLGVLEDNAAADRAAKQDDDMEGAL